ncbi:MAG: hypothetical protein VXU50_07580, partial [Verrucomicrobiota bacterium]|nr:hypothetical protein [Verrucomicrobiota bacterium]
ITNSHSSYARIQKALRAREYHEPLPADDILVEYADAVVSGVLRAYERQYLQKSPCSDDACDSRKVSIGKGI